MTQRFAADEHERCRVGFAAQCLPSSVLALSPFSLWSASPRALACVSLGSTVECREPGLWAAALPLDPRRCERRCELANQCPSGHPPPSRRCARWPRRSGFPFTGGCRALRDGPFTAQTTGQQARRRHTPHAHTDEDGGTTSGRHDDGATASHYE
jgi:hypothetical protein